MAPCPARLAGNGSLVGCACQLPAPNPAGRAVQVRGYLHHQALKNCSQLVGLTKVHAQAVQWWPASGWGPGYRCSLWRYHTAAHDDHVPHWVDMLASKQELHLHTSQCDCLIISAHLAHTFLQLVLHNVPRVQGSDVGGPWLGRLKVRMGCNATLAAQRGCSCDSAVALTGLPVCLPRRSWTFRAATLLRPPSVYVQPPRCAHYGYRTALGCS